MFYQIQYRISLDNKNTMAFNHLLLPFIFFIGQNHICSTLKGKYKRTLRSVSTIKANILH